ncbi:MAG: hypothetical protein IPQ23_22535 [Cytophagaceae bacterium]|nr:hypothetical protein [Cytophagaceae bacterium]
MVSTLPSRSLEVFQADQGQVLVELRDGVWFAVAQVVALACGKGPVTLATSGPVDLRAFDKMLQALHLVSSANFQPDIEPPDFSGRVVEEKCTAEVWWRSGTVPGRIVTIFILYGESAAWLSWNTGTGSSSRHIMQVFSGIAREDLL